MALQFPDQPVVGQPSGTYEYTAPDGTVITYTWDGEKWTAQVGGGDGQVPGGDSSERPTSPSVGELYYDTTIDQLLYWNGSEWVAITGQPPAEGGEPATIYVKLDDDGTKQVIKSAGLGISNGTDENITLTSEGNIELFSNANAGIELRKRFGVGQDTDRAVLVRNLALDETASIKHDGSATFTNHIKIGGTLPASPNISLNADGTATFAEGKLEIDNRGTITRPGSGGDYYSIGVFNNSGTNTGSTGGRIVLSSDAGNGLDTETIALNGQDGSATFIGTEGASLSICRDATAANIASDQSIGNIDFADNAGGQFAIISAQPDGAAGLDNYPGRILFHTTSANFASPVERMRIDSLGNVGIGAKTIGVNGLHVRNANEVSLRLDHAGSNTWDITNDSNLKFSRGGTERMRIDNVGNVKIGNAADQYQVLASASANLQISGGIVFEPGAGNDAEIISYRASALKLGVGEKETMRIDSSGNVLIGSTLPDSPNISLNADGSASFAAPVQVGNTPSDGANAGARISSNGPIEVARGDGQLDLWKGYLVGTSTPTSSIKADGSAEFQGTVKVAGGAVQPLIIGDTNGDDIDVRERLEAARETFQELQVAVANATDFAALKAAMLVALEDYA